MSSSRPSPKNKARQRIAAVAGNRRRAAEKRIAEQGNKPKEQGK